MKTLGFKKIPLTSGAYIFHGQDMIGKRTYALELAGEIAHVSDIFIAHTDIEAIRGVKHFLSLSPLNGNRKIVLIDQANRMQEEAQNAILKILEEPSASSIIILITSQLEGLLPTITSRCQVVYFPPHGRVTMLAFLKDKNLSSSQMDFLCQFSNGSIGLLDGDFSKIKSYAQEYSMLAKADLARRFDIAKELAVDVALAQKILFWMLYLRTKQLYKPLRGLLELYQTISQPQFNRQLALENFMLQL